MSDPVDSSQDRRGAFGAAARFVGFGVAAIAVVVLLSSLLAPPFSADARYSIQGAYEQPRDSVQVATFGTSALRKGFSPDRFYERYGVVSYDSCSNAQPVIASYYLLKDLLKAQGGSLKVVLLDANTLVKNDVKTYGAERVAAVMRPSLTKVEYLTAISEEYEELELSEQLIPVLRYHTRWEELMSNGNSDAVANAYQYHFHGQNIYGSIFTSNLAEGTTEKNTYEKRNAGITEARERDQADLEGKLFDLSRRYMDKIVELCRESGVTPVLVKVPASNWGDFQHDSVSLYAEQRGVEFIDMASPEIWEECGFSYDTDFSDDRHVNLGGSLKVTDYLGAYLVEHFDLQPTPDGNAVFTAEDLAFFDDMVEDDQLKSSDDLLDYLERIDRDRYTVFIAAKGEAAEGLGHEERAKLQGMGLVKLAALEPNESYVGIYDGGECVVEEVAPDGAEALIVGSYERGELSLGAGSSQAASDKAKLMLASGGSSEGDRAVIAVEGENRSEKQRGINFSVFNRVMDLPIDASGFDTHVGSQRTSER